MPATLTIARPDPTEYAPFYQRYLDRLEGDDALAFLREQREMTQQLLAGVDDARALSRYAPGKWSVKEVLNHMGDAERVFSYRALVFARNDRGPLPGFDEETWTPQSRADERPLADLLAELRALRDATLALFGSLDAERLVRQGIANDSPSSVRSLAWIIAGHERHHLGILRERYGLGG